MIRNFPLFLILSLLAEILGTVGGFGSSVFFVPMANLFLDFHAVLGITAVFHLSSNLTKIGAFRKGLDWKLALRMGIPAIILVTVGAYLSKFFNPDLLELGLGVFLLLLSLVFLIFRNLKIKGNSINVTAGGALSGLLAGLLGTGGAIRGLTLTSLGLSKDVFIATSAVIDLGIDLSRTVVYYNNGYMRADLFYFIPALLIVSIAGTFLGKRIVDNISQTQFRKFTLFLILLIGMATMIQALVK